MADKTSINIDYVADLARLHLSDGEKATYSAQLGKVLEHFAHLDEVDVSGVEPTAHAAPVFNVWREDAPGPVMSVDEVLLNAPAKRDGQFLMPRVVAD